MNKCLRCLNTFSDSHRVCPKCSFSNEDDATKTLSKSELNKNQSTKILSDKKMTPERWKKVKDLFEQAESVSYSKREQFLNKACGDDDEIKSQVKKLLDSLEEVHTSFLKEPAEKEVVSEILDDHNTRALNVTTGQVRATDMVAGTVLDNRYRILGLLGKGGMGEVYKAEDLTLGQTVALKFLPDRLAKNEDALRRFIGEVKTARQVSHENVCRVFDIGEVNGNRYLSMEFIEGDDLSQLLTRIGRLPAERAIEIARQICMGLNAIHKTGILHRDLKPANIIIDSKGKARITDFGIAGFEADVQGKEVKVGTPAYMSPEQITGKEVTTRSDIYSLGLLLYEIFTGKQAVQGETLDEIIKKHTQENATNPSQLVESLNPLVENVIKHCLEKKPEDRPKSAVQVALAMPGGNPLELALEAGETPTPEMVVAAPKKGALRPKFALGMLVTFIIVYFGILILNQGYKAHTITPFDKPPEVLTERSRQLLKEFGYEETPRDEDSHFINDPSFRDYYKYNDKSLNLPPRLEMISKGQAALIYFIYRSSPEYLRAKDTVNVTEDDPAMNVPSMAKIKLDTSGHLYEFVKIPAKTLSKANVGELDWGLFFKEAGLDFEKFKEVEPTQTPTVLADKIRAWEGTLIDVEQVKVRIEAAEFQGKAVYFKKILPWSYADKNSARQERRNIANIILTIIFLSIIFGILWLVFRNVKAGRGDIEGSLKLGFALFAILFVSEILIADHIPVPTVKGEIGLLLKSAGYAGIVAVITAAFFLALEPLIRRLWSGMLISWLRLLAGDFRDPMVGRDILMGGLLGLGWCVGIHISLFLQVIYLDNYDLLWLNRSADPLIGMSGFISYFLHTVRETVTSGFTSILLAFIPFLITKNKWVGILSLGIVFFSVIGLMGTSDGHWLALVSIFLNTICLMVAVWRYGLLGTISFWLVFYLVWDFPITFNSSSFYFPQTIFIILIILSIAVYSFYTSIAGQPIIGKLDIDPSDLP